MTESQCRFAKNYGVASLKDDGITSLGDNSSDERAVLPSLMARIKPVGEDWRPPKSTFWDRENLSETYLWDYQSDDSEDGYLLRASQANEGSVVQATVEAAKMTTTASMDL